MSFDEVADIFRQNAGPVLEADDVETVIEKVRGLEAEEDIAALGGVLSRTNK
jgi:hypothetical protein